MPTDRSSVNVLKVAREHFGFDSLRPGQKEAVQALVNGKDVVVVQPTGAGKSAIYQIAGLMIEGVTVIVSPLIALQKDQVDAIAAEKAAEAVVVNSQQRAAELAQTLDNIEQGRVEYIFLAPEQLRKQETLDRLKTAGVSLFVVDEAHCISAWGHDFRPDYLQISPAIERLGHPPVLAMTATASPDVRREIVERLGMREPRMLVHGFDRPNISLRVDHFESEADKLEALARSVNWAEKPGIVYVGTRKKAEEVAAALGDSCPGALCYHAGLKRAHREAIQNRFMGGQAEVIVATNAFGMGIDKPDVRFVYHYDISGSLDEYYQEIGRAGRDGKRSEAILFYRNANVGAQKFRTGSGKLDPAEVRQVVGAVASHDGPVATGKVAEEIELSDRKVTTALHRLADAGAVEILTGGEVERAEEVDLEAAAHAAVEQQERQQEMRREKLRLMQEYADASSCRREILLRYFGDDFTGPCGNCDNCNAASPAAADEGTRREVA